MGVLQRFERRLEGLVEGTFARVFGGVVQPVEVAAALQREAGEKKVLVAPGRILVPNEFVVELGHSDAERLRAYDAPLRREFAAMVSEHAAEQGWSFVGPVEVQLEPADGLDTGMFRVRSAVVAGAEPAAPPAPDRAQAPWVAAPAGYVAPPTAPPAASPRRALAYLLVTDRLSEGRSNERRVDLQAQLTRVGRGAEADLRLTDTGVSRLHAEVHLAIDGSATVVDLQSTNGLTVNGVRVQSAPLHDGDRIGVGSTGIVFRLER